ncbi:hypothetical protein BDV18DRAFT_160843 [Aspergillus unguis]
MRKRPMSDKPPNAMRAIQPRPTVGPASYSSESGASTILSPGSGPATAPGEPPRKRGRPSKVEAERRKAAAAERGETYQPSRRSGSNKGKAPPTPTNAPAIEAGVPVYTAQTGNRPPNIPPPVPPYVPPPLRPMSMPMPMSGHRPGSEPHEEERVRAMSNREIGPNLRELPRPQEFRQTLPSPHSLQLGHRESIPRIEPGDRPFESMPSDRLPFPDSSRRSLVHPSPRAPDEPYTPDTQNPPNTTAEKRT